MSPKRFINDLPSPRRRRIVPIGSRLWSCFLASRFFFPFFFFGIFRSFGEFHFILRRMRTMPHCGTCRTRMGLSAASCKIYLPRGRNDVEWMEDLKVSRVCKLLRSMVGFDRSWFGDDCGSERRWKEVVFYFLFLRASHLCTFIFKIFNTRDIRLKILKYLAHLNNFSRWPLLLRRFSAKFPLEQVILIIKRQIHFYKNTW